MSKIRRTPVQLAVLLALTPLGVQAQEAVEAGKLSTVTVTAERRSENIKDVPSSVSTLSGEALDVLNSGGQDIRLLSGRVPSLNIESSFGRAFPRFYIRGYGNTDFRLNASQPVSLVYDDVVQENPILKGFPAFDLERIEVLAGPQGTLFGRNTPAGVVKFNSVAPSQKQDGYASLSYGTYDTVNAEAAFNLPLTGAWSARISGLVQSRGDWVDNTIASSPTHQLEGYDDRAFRLQALYAADRTFSALFNIHNRDLKGSARLFRANIIKPGTNDLVDGFEKDKISIDGANEQSLSSTGASARLKWAFGDVSLYSITGYETVSTFSRGDVDGGFGAVFLPPPIPSGPGVIPFSSETADGIHGHTQFTQELRAESNNPGPVNWQAGLYYFDERYDIESFSYDSLGASAQNGFERVHQSNTAYAAFGALTYAIAPAWTVRGGLRYTHDTKDFEVQDYTSSVFGTLPDLAALAAGGPLTAHLSNGKASWDASATYALNRDVNLYARVANSFRAGSVQGAGAFNAQSIAGPETNTSYEAGAKADLFDRRARAAFSVFHYQVKDQQLTAVGGGSNSTLLLNAKKATGSGAELNFDAYLTEQLLVKLSGSYNKTKIQDPNLAVGVCAACTVTSPTFVDTDGNTRALIDGNPLPNAPKWIANVSARYGWPTQAGGEFYIYTDWTYRSKVNFFLYESVEFTGKPLTEGGLRLGYLWSGGKYEAAVFARNITDQVRVNGAIDFNNLTGFINEPRTYGAQFKATF